MTRHSRIDHLKQVLEFNPANVTAGLEMAHLQEEDGNILLAEFYYIQAIRQAPKDPRIRSAAAAFLRRTGRPELAAKVMQPNYIP